MEFQELTDLIKIRDYIFNTVNNNPSIDRATVSELNGLLILTDKKIVGMLKHQDFKSYVGYQDLRQAIEEVVRLNNIKSGLSKK